MSEDINKCEERFDNGPLHFDIKENNPDIYIKVVGVGGGGGNAVQDMYKEGIKDVSFAVCNTDSQALKASPIPVKIQLGDDGLGAGNRPSKAREAAEKSLDKIEEMLDTNCRMVFITATMGGGTGTGAAPVIAKTAKDKGILTVGIVTVPFKFERHKKIDQALDGVEEMSKNVDALLVINNQRLYDVCEGMTMREAFAKANENITIAAKSIAEIITIHGYINLDFNDVKNVLQDGGVAILSMGYGEGPHRVQDAIKDALNSPLLNDNDVYKSKKIVFNIASSSEHEVKIDEMTEVENFMENFDSNIWTKWGAYINEDLGEKVKFTILASGFGLRDIPELKDRVETRMTVEDKKRQEEMEREEERRAKRRADFYGKDINEESVKHKVYNYYRFTREALDDDEVINKVSIIPTYKRSVHQLEEIMKIMDNREKEEIIEIDTGEITEIKF